MTKDREALADFIPSDQSEQFMYYWMVVNTRCFYWAPKPARKKQAWRQPKLEPDDCMTLCPFADYFNHTSKGCDFDSNLSRCWVTCDRDYEAGEEVYLSYGKHSNDMLLAEYGFIFDGNMWDHVKLDELILPQLSVAQKEALEEANFLG